MEQVVKHSVGEPELYLPFVRKVATRIARRLPDSVDVDDLVGAGTIGLMEALERYTPGSERTFETYAEFRVKGAIFDELRRNDPLNRGMRTSQGKISAKANELTAELGRPPTAEEIARALKARSSHEVRLKQSMRVVSTDMGLFDVADDSEDQEKRLAKAEAIGQMREAIAALPGRQQTILSLCYVEGLSQVEVAEVMGVTESRISQILSQVRRDLRARLEREEGRCG